MLVDRFWSLSSRKKAKTTQTLLVSRALREVLLSFQFQIPNISFQSSVMRKATWHSLPSFAFPLHNLFRFSFPIFFFFFFAFLCWVSFFLWFNLAVQETINELEAFKKKFKKLLISATAWKALDSINFLNGKSWRLTKMMYFFSKIKS